MIKTSCYLNHLGIINAIGATPQEVAINLFNNRSFLTDYIALFSGRKTMTAAVTAPLINIPDKLSEYDCRNNRLLATAYETIKEEVTLLKTKYGSNRIGVILGTSTSGIAASEAAYKQYLHDHTFPEEFAYIQQEIGSCSEFLARYADVTGIHYTISAACSSSGKAIAAAARLIQTGCCDVVIAGGSDSLCELTLNGFDSLELLSPTRTNPFSINRNGINIGEGAALFIITKEPAPIKLMGCGESSDGYHMTAPDPEGKGAKLAMTQALAAANLDPEAIGYINLHGTGTKKNDAMETVAINELFGADTLCSSTKPLIGHTLGAAAAQELGLCWLLLSDEYNSGRLLPAQVWDQQPDPELPKINLVPAMATWQKPIFMSNSFAFGGSNISLIIGKGRL